MGCIGVQSEGETNPPKRITYCGENTQLVQGRVILPVAFSAL